MSLKATRRFNALVGCWLVASAFLWPHVEPQFRNTVTIGVATAVIPAMGVHLPKMRHMNSAVSMWLFASVFVLPVESTATFWNNLLVALLVTALSILPRRRDDKLTRHDTR